MIWGLVALAVLAAGAIAWAFGQGLRLRGLESDLRREKALSAQKMRIAEALAKAEDNEETREKIEKLRDVDTFGDLVRLYRNELE